MNSATAEVGSNKTDTDGGVLVTGVDLGGGLVASGVTRASRATRFWLESSR